MKRLHPLARTGLYIVGGAAAGYLYYRFFGCTSGCAISSNPWNSMLYMGFVGWLMSGVLAPKKEEH